VGAAAAGAPKFGGGCGVLTAALVAGAGVLADVDPKVKDGCGATASVLLMLAIVPVLAAEENAAGATGTGPGCGVLAAVAPNAKAGCAVAPGCGA
jgi:hypothetical protein